MIDFYFWTTPNGYKVLLFLEESGMAYRMVPTNISAGEQFEPAFLRISPNNRIPAIVDHAPGGSNISISVFESGAILTLRKDWANRTVTATGSGASTIAAAYWKLSSGWINNWPETNMSPAGLFPLRTSPPCVPSI